MCFVFLSEENRNQIYFGLFFHFYELWSTALRDDSYFGYCLYFNTKSYTKRLNAGIVFLDNGSNFALFKNQSKEGIRTDVQQENLTISLMDNVKFD